MLRYSQFKRPKQSINQKSIGDVSNYMQMLLQAEIRHDVPEENRNQYREFLAGFAALQQADTFLSRHVDEIKQQYEHAGNLFPHLAAYSNFHIVSKPYFQEEQGSYFCSISLGGSYEGRIKVPVAHSAMESIISKDESESINAACLKKASTVLHDLISTNSSGEQKEAETVLKRVEKALQEKIAQKIKEKKLFMLKALSVGTEALKCTITQTADQKLFNLRFTQNYMRKEFIPSVEPIPFLADEFNRILAHMSALEAEPTHIVAGSLKCAWAGIGIVHYKR